MILPIYIYGMAVLRMATAHVQPDYPDLKGLISNMFETLSHADGVGLAAPQVGLSLRLAVIDLDVISDDAPEYKGFRRAYINPQIIEKDTTQTDLMEEGCLSLPGIHESVRRPTRIHVKYQDENFQEHDEWVDGFLARVMQHEFDHLDAHLFIDHLSPLRKQMIKGKLSSMLKGKYRCSYKTKSLK